MQSSKLDYMKAADTIDSHLAELQTNRCDMFLQIMDNFCSSNHTWEARPNTRFILHDANHLVSNHW